MLWVVFIVIIAVVATGSCGAKETASTSKTASNNTLKVLSENQLNILSDVYNCIGAGSCSDTTDSNNTTVHNSVDMRNAQTGNLDFYVSPVDGAVLCRDTDGVMRPSACPEGFTGQ
jgi:hypothetical protein